MANPEHAKSDEERKRVILLRELADDEEFRQVKGGASRRLFGEPGEEEPLWQKIKRKRRERDSR